MLTLPGESLAILVNQPHQFRPGRQEVARLHLGSCQLDMRGTMALDPLQQ